MIVTDAEFALHAVKHFTSEVEEHKKFKKLCHLLAVSEFNHAVVFVNDPGVCGELVERLKEEKVNVIIQTEAEKLTLYQRLSLFFGKKVNISPIYSVPNFVDFFRFNLLKIIVVFFLFAARLGRYQMC